MPLQERIDAAIALGELGQGGFLDDPDLQELLKDPLVQAAFDERITECDGCGRIWPREGLEYSEGSIEGLLCFYCFDEEENEDEN